MQTSAGGQGSLLDCRSEARSELGELLGVMVVKLSR